MDPRQTRAIMAESDTIIYPGSGPSWGINTPTPAFMYCTAKALEVQKGFYKAVAWGSCSLDLDAKMEKGEAPSTEQLP
jgi:hypothetical protein